MRVKKESELTGLKLNIQKTKIIETSPMTSWQIEGEKVEAETDLIFLGSKITADSDCSHRFKKTLAPWKTSYDKPCSRCCSVAKFLPTLFDPIDCSTPDFSVPYHFPEFAQVHVH